MTRATDLAQEAATGLETLRSRTTPETTIVARNMLSRLRLLKDADELRERPSPEEGAPSPDGPQRRATPARP